MRTRQSDSPSRLREGPVTRHCNVLIEKDVKPKVDPIEPDDTSRESGKPEENNDNSDNDNDNDNVNKLVVLFYLFVVQSVDEKNNNILPFLAVFVLLSNENKQIYLCNFILGL